MIPVPELSRWVEVLLGRHHVAVTDNGHALYCVEVPTQIIIVGTDKPLECQNCGIRLDESELKNRFPNIPDLAERIAPGEKVPYGECPLCAALVHAFDEHAFDEYGDE